LSQKIISNHKFNEVLLKYLKIKWEKSELTYILGEKLFHEIQHKFKPQAHSWLGFQKLVECLTKKQDYNFRFSYCLVYYNCGVLLCSYYQIIGGKI
jgi:hypothetical protein